MAATVRWTFTEVSTSVTETFPFNPDSMGSPFPARSLHFYRGAAQDRATTVVETPRPKEWKFSGPIRTVEHRDFLLKWQAKSGLIDVTDHRGWTYRCLLTDCPITERQPTKRNPHRYRYEMKTLVLGIAAPL